MFRRQDAGRIPGRLGRVCLVFWKLAVALGLGLAALTSETAERNPVWSGTLSAAPDAAEFHVSLRARAPGAAWHIAGRESAALKILIDGCYDQHVFLAAGETTLSYDFIAGPLSAGDHRLRLEWQSELTPALIQPPEVLEVTITPLPLSDASLEPVFRSPSIYLRADTIGRFTDVPLMVYWEHDTQVPGKVVYTVILSNEDGGTNTERLMARWGRTTDIEWCYAYGRAEGILQETYQGRDHETLHFRGAYDGRHPRLFDITHNNIFSDQPSGSQTVRVRPFPVYQDLKAKTRESVMDRHAWIYPLMAHEMIREGKIEEPADPHSALVSDLRNYAYVDVCARQHGTELRFEGRLRGNSRWFSSDHGDPKARIERSGCFRSTIELPPGTTAAQLGTLRIQCLAAPSPKGQNPVKDPQARIESVGPVFLLREDYLPSTPVKLEPVQRVVLEPGRSVAIAFLR